MRAKNKDAKVRISRYSAVPLQKNRYMPYHCYVFKICQSSTWQVRKSKLQSTSNLTVAEYSTEKTNKVEVVQFAGYKAAPTKKKIRRLKFTTIKRSREPKNAS